MNCGHPASEISYRKRAVGRVEPVCKACWREYMKAYRETYKLPTRSRRIGRELEPVVIWPELARRAW